jgi:hypothetical protein
MNTSSFGLEHDPAWNTELSQQCFKERKRTNIIDNHFEPYGWSGRIRDDRCIPRELIRLLLPDDLPDALVACRTLDEGARPRLVTEAENANSRPKQRARPFM